VSARELLGPEGPLASGLPGYRARDGQIELAQAIEAALSGESPLLAEAGTGIGKTFAYLVPLMSSGRRAMVSTATRSLQDQLFNRDIPRLRELLRADLQVARLKGRSNYLCVHRLALAQSDARLATPRDAQALRTVEQFAQVSTDGDIAGCEGVPESSSIWPLVTSNTENCLGQNCPSIGSCHVIKAREKAAAADLIVVNHHLLCADMALRQQGSGDLLPAVEAVVIDEAHALPDIATQFFGAVVSSHGLSTLCRESLTAGLMHARDGADWAGLCGAVELATLKLRAALELPQQQARRRWTDLTGAQRLALDAAWPGLTDALEALRAAQSENAPRHAELERLNDRSALVLERMSQVLPDETAPAGSPEGVHWIEISKQGISLHWAPIDIASILAPLMAEPLARHWVFVSATLALRDFSYFSSRLGLVPEQSLQLPSPFQYHEQALLVVPEDLPDPKAADLMDQLLAHPGLEGLMAASPGGIFVLCTSLRAVEQARVRLEAWRKAGRLQRTVYVQGEAARDKLLAAFRADGQGILVGSASFWEGVDVPGTALSLVIIDKLPFASPDDPILEARMAACRARGGDPFREIQLPEATLALKQGAGRLIRTETDRGVLVVGDRRLAESAYGRQMLKSLPAFRRTRKLEEAREFFPDLQLGPDPT
jgi:ATP-dependent DNA helicase DinG